MAPSNPHVTKVQKLEFWDAERLAQSYTVRRGGIKLDSTLQTSSSEVSHNSEPMTDLPFNVYFFLIWKLRKCREYKGKNEIHLKSYQPEKCTCYISSIILTSRLLDILDFSQVDSKVWLILRQWIQRIECPRPYRSYLCRERLSYSIIQNFKKEKSMVEQSFWNCSS